MKKKEEEERSIDKHGQKTKCKANMNGDDDLEEYKKK
jgi:hypothetical protein